MQENATIARPYAQAVFEEARGQGRLDEWSAMLSLLALMVADPDLRRVIGDPRIGRSRLQNLLFDIAGERLSSAGRNFVKVVLDAGRLLLVAEMSKQFENLRAETLGVADVDVVSAYPLDREQERVIVNAVRRRIGKDVNVKTQIDEALIGGVVIRVGDLVIDASLRGRLRQLANQFR